MTVRILMPALSPTMTEGTLARWLVGEGDSVSSGDVIAEIETDKATMEVESIDDGVMGKILVAEGSEKVAVNSVIAILLEDGESASDIDAADVKVDVKTEKKPDDKAESKPAESKPKPEPKPEPKSEPKTPVKESVKVVDKSVDKGERIFITPLAKRLSQEKGLDVRGIKGSGPHGRIIKADIENVKASGVGLLGSVGVIDASKNMEFEALKLNTMRKVIAERLSESKQTVPHFYLSRDCILDNLLEMRRQVNLDGGDSYKVSVNDIVIKASAQALQDVPLANAEWGGDIIKLYRHSNISVAVAIDGGLITPVIWQAESKGLLAISGEMRDLAGLAKGGKLTPEQYQGGSFSISNLGMYGVDNFSAVINPPQACILAVGAGVPRPIVEDGVVVVRTVMSVTLSVDHRAVDGAVGAEFLRSFVSYIENPVRLLLR